MSNKLLISSLAATVLLASSLLSSTDYIPNLNDELQYNQKMIQEYQEGIQKLQKRVSYLTKIKKENPKLYISKALYEDTKDEYIYRVKLNGAKAKNLNFTIKNHMVFLEMRLKTERNDDTGYYSSSQSFYQNFSIPKNVEESKIQNRVDGDYFEIIMPKK